MKLKNENEILFLIRYALPIFTLVVSIVISIFLYFETEINLKKLKKETKDLYIEEQKHLVKSQVENVYNYILEEQRYTEDNLKESLKSRVEEAHKIIVNIYNTYKETHSKEQIKEMIKTAVYPMRFNNGRGYFFVNDKKGNNLIHPLLHFLEGKNLLNTQDSKGKYFARKTLEILENNEGGFDQWYWRKFKDSKKEYKKIGYVKNIYELNWLIGTGEYVEDFEKDVQQKVLEQIDKFKFSKNGYFVVINKNGKYIQHPRKNLLGKDAYDILKDANDSTVVKKAKNISSLGEGFLKLNFSKLNDENSYSKISYAKKIPKWDWIISTGFYLDDINKVLEKKEKEMVENFNENTRKIFMIATIFSLALLLISFYISVLIEKRFKKYKFDIEKHVDENKKQYELLSQQSKLASMGEMMENIAHQWRQPLSLITTAASSINFQKDMDMLTDESLKESVDTINNSANHLSETIEDFRGFFRTNKQVTKFSLSSSLEKTFKLLSSHLEKRDIEVIKNIKDIELLNYERELLQVLLNILNNAKDALEEKDNEKIIIIDIFEEDKYAVIQISDNAGGIPDDIIKKVFEAHFTTKGEIKGTGLGLYMSKQIIERNMNGLLDVCNTQFDYKGVVQKGAKFIIKIPK
ncbi:cache domain-containing protein [Arcobacter sp. YIC-80]|uniref:sensor histidine kinase n=1 Tax=Arcobacter sp. YIC-80 TaxID=3376683 RepID=UPI00384DAA6E